MQTFLPYKDFDQSAQALDNKRLNKQILEGYQILKVIGNPDPKAAWRNHPAVKMWRGAEQMLYKYIFAMVHEADKRGIKTDKNVANLLELADKDRKTWHSGYPTWFDNKALMDRVLTTHKANLFIKDSAYYHEFESALRNDNNEPCCERCSYFWPTHKETK